jgi:O-antigen/teichoic acid export membrane protein
MAEAEKADSPLKRLLVQTSHYGIASMFTMLAGLVTFPLLTRIFSVADYGVMSLVAATVTVAVAIGKVGMQHSIVRYRSEISEGKGRFSLPQLYSTTFYGMVGTGLAVTAILIAGVRVAPARWFGDSRLASLFGIAGFLVLIQVTESALTNFLRAEQRTATLMKYQVVKKYLTLAFIVVAILLISRTLRGFYTASVLSEGLAVAALTFTLFGSRERPHPEIKQFSRPLYLELLAFGLPMMIGYEMSGIALAVGDRYVIQGTIGEGPLGLYAAAYNLCQYVQAVFIASIGQAIMPIYMQMWDQKGRDETSDFISRSLRRYLLFGAPVIAGLAAVGPELLPSLASDKYAPAGAVLPWVIAGMVLDGAQAMLGAGLFIHRRTRTIMVIVLSCALLNIGLNLVLVPRIGVVGAAIATLVAYAASSLTMAIAGRNLLPVHLPWASMARAGLASAVMYLAVIFVLPGHRLLTVGVRAAMGALIYALIMVMIDEDAKTLWSKIRARL